MDEAQVWRFLLRGCSQGALYLLQVVINLAGLIIMVIIFIIITLFIIIIFIIIVVVAVVVINVTFIQKKIYVLLSDIYNFFWKKL